MEENIITPLPPKNNRNKGHKYIDKNNNIVIWNGNRLHCEHGKEKCKCKICGGVGICIHNKLKGICKECGGKQLCKHDKIKSKCKDCGGGSICIHNKLRSLCKECKGGSICIHNKSRTHCKECKGGSICIHNRQRSQCKECKGGSICIHNKIKSKCKDCGGVSICIHKKNKFLCIECNGSQICIHKKRKYDCSICYSTKRTNLCSNCKYIKGSKKYISSKNTYEKLCIDCYYHLYPDEKKIPTKYKKKQHFIHEKLKERYGKDYFKYDVKIECGCSGKIPDWFVDCYNFVLNIECDENQHKGNETSCENKRLCELFLDCNSRPFVCIRFNPDSYKIEEKKIEGCFSFDEKNNIIVNQEEFEKRFELLVEKIDYYLENGSKKDIECIKLFYDESNTKFKM